VSGTANGTNGNNHVSRAADFTAMRQRMTAETDVRIVMGGRMTGQQGRWPGVVEEAYLAIRAGQPLFIAGGLAGAAARVAGAVQGGWPVELTTDHQRTRTRGYDELLVANIWAF
jgi:hypothetical protein